AGGVAEHVPHCHLLLAVSAELRPQIDDWRVVSEQPTLGKHVRHSRGSALEDREVVEGSVRCDKTSGRRVGDARDRVDDQPATLVRSDLHAALGSRIDQLVYRLLDLSLDLLLDLPHATASPSSIAISISVLVRARNRKIVSASVIIK